MKRKLLKFSILLLVLALLFFGVIQAVLWSDLPRQWAIRIIQSQLGMVTDLQNLTIGWNGHTEIKGLRLGLPVENEPFLKIDTISVHHNSLAGLALSRQVQIQTVKIDGVDLSCRLQKNQRWNLVDAIDMLKPLLAGNSNQSHTSLPQVVLNQANLTVVDSEGNPHPIGPVHFEAESDPEFRWHFQVQDAEHTIASGSLALPQLQSHELTFDLSGWDEVLSVFVPDCPGPVNIQGHWSGAFNANRLQGELTLQQACLGPYHASGNLSVAVMSDTILVEPKDLTVTDPALSDQPLVFTDGMFQYHASLISMEQLQLTLGENLFALNGSYRLADATLAMGGTWIFNLPDEEISNHATWQATATVPLAGKKQATVEVTMSGRTPRQQAKINALITAQAADWQQAGLQIALNHIELCQDNEWVFPKPLTMAAHVDNKGIYLDKFDWPQARDMTVQGQYRFKPQDWQITIDANSLDIPHWLEAPVSLETSLAGSGSQFNIDKAHVNYRDLILDLNGEVSLKDMRLVNSYLQLQETMDPLRASPFQAWQFTGQLQGDLAGFNLNGDGDLVVDQINLGAQPLDSLLIPVNVSTRLNSITVASNSFALLEGRSSINGNFDLQHGNGVCQVQFRDISLPRLSQILGSDQVQSGLFSGGLTIQVPQFDWQKLTASGHWELANLTARALDIQQAGGAISMKNGQILFDPVILHNRNGDVRGTVGYTVNHSKKLDLNIDMSHWPVEFDPDFQIEANGCAEVSIDLDRDNINGNVLLSGPVHWQGHSLGELTIHSDIVDRDIRIASINGDLLGGAINGSAGLPLDNWQNFQAQLKYQDARLDQLTQWYPSLIGLTGRLSSQINIGPAQGAHPLEPLTAVISSSSDDARFKSIQIGPALISAHIGPERLVVDTFDCQVMNGWVRNRARLSRHADRLWLYLSSDLDRLDLAQLTQTLQPESRPVVGRISGKSVLVLTTDPNSMSGQIDLKISDSDLINSTIFTALYNAMNLKGLSAKPQGEGSLRLNVNGTRAEFTSFYYFNHGIEVRGTARIADLTLGINSPIEGFVFGTSRPLKDLRLPGIEELDQLMTSLQNSTAVVKISGTMGQPEVSVIPFPEVSNSIRKLLWGQLKE